MWKTCLACRKTFFARTSQTKYCSQACLIRKLIKRRRKKRLAKINELYEKLNNLSDYVKTQMDRLEIYKKENDNIKLSIIMRLYKQIKRDLKNFVISFTNKKREKTNNRWCYKGIGKTRRR